MVFLHYVRSKIAFSATLHSQTISFATIQPYAPNKALAQAETVRVAIFTLEESGWVGFTSDGDGTGSYGGHCQLATAVITM